jgi:hypothetical protein
MYSGKRWRPGIAIVCLFCLSVAVRSSEAQQLRIESLYPRQAPRGQATVLNLAIASREHVQSVEINPASGVRVSNVKAGENFQGALTWWEVTLEVAADAADGERSLVLVMPKTRSMPMSLTIPSHIPSITQLRVAPVQSKPPVLDAQFDVTDPSADIGDSPYVWFMLDCGGEPLPGVIHGKLAAGDKRSGTVRATIPTPRMPTNPGGRCDLQVRVSDSRGIESNTLKTPVELKN